LIIAGASAKGPYAAGALSVLARCRDFDVRCVLGASSGALNAAVYAAGLRVGEADVAADNLCALWRNQAKWFNILTHCQRVAIVRNALLPFVGKPPQREVSLSIPLASLQGSLDKYGHMRFEKNYAFETTAFETVDGINEIAEVCILSSTIPLVFPPRKFRSEQFWDGGIVDDTPIGNALKCHPAIDHMLVVTPDSNFSDPRRRYGWFSLSRLLEMVIEERLARDLTEAQSFNDELLALCRAGVDLNKLGPEIRWKLLQFVEIRPERELRGNLATGFFSAAVRDEYVTTGHDTAKKVLEHWKPQVFPTGGSDSRQPKD
jgi:predicted acylesterase/phospholipase RssA